MAPHWHLAIECSSTGGSVALFQKDTLGGNLLYNQLILPENQGSVQTLAPAIDELVRNAQLPVSSVQSISITNGPGSFTGLRVGLTTAKMLAWANRIPVVPVDTLHAMAWRFCHSGPHSDHQPSAPYRLVTAINAYRRQVFSANWIVDNGRLINCQPSAVMDAATWLKRPWSTLESDAQSQNVGQLWITGHALTIYPGVDQSEASLAPVTLWQPLAEDVGRIGLEKLTAGLFVSAADLAPNYIRASAAEENARA